MNLPGKYEQLTVGTIRVLGEKDGATERDVKNRFSEFLASNGYPCRAYLARVQYDDSYSVNVALLVKLDAGNQDQVEQKLGHVFRELMFSSDQHLDIIFLTQSEEERIKSLIPSFYASEEH